MLSYQDGPAAMDWLAKAFGFVEKTRWLDENGRLTHGEMTAGDGLIMLAEGPPGYQSPKAHRDSCQAAAEWSRSPYVVDGALVYVDDVRAHFERARGAGARLLSDVESAPPGDLYRVEDIEGHRWMFMQRG